MDEQYLGVDVQFGGVDQRKIFTYAEKYLPKLGYAKRSHLMNPMVPGLTGGKMSSSEVDSKIDLLDSREAVERKLLTSVCDPAEPDNGVMAFVNFVVFPVLENQGKLFTLADGTTFNSFDALKKKFIGLEVEGEDIKTAVIKVLNGLLDFIRKEFQSEELKDLSSTAYPIAVQDPSTDKVANNIDRLPLTGTSKSCGELMEIVTRNLVLPVPITLTSVVDKMCTVLWEVDVTDRPTISILGHLAKIRDFLDIGWNVIVNVNDVISHLNGGQISWDIASSRADLFIGLIKASCEVLKIPTDNVKFMKGSDFQLKENYALDLYRMSALITCSDANIATANVLNNPTLLSGLLIPDMVTLDEKHLKADVHYMASNAKSLGDFAEKNISIVGKEATVHIYGHTMPSLLCRSALTLDQEYIELTEQEASLKKKIKASFCEEGNVEFNPVLHIVRHIILPLLETGDKFVVVRAEEHGGNLEFDSADKVQESFIQKILHPGDLKNSVLQYLKKYITPIIKKIDNSSVKGLMKTAYPLTKKTKGPAKSSAANSDEFSPSQFNMIVGKIVDISLHPDADSLYVEQIDVGEEIPRTIVSGLVKYVPIEEMLGRMVIVLVNLKPQPMRGVKSSGMVLCASVSEPNAAVEPLLPPEGSRPGDRVQVEGHEGDPVPQLNTKKSDALSKMLADFQTNARLQATWNNNLLMTPAGPVTVPSLRNAPIK